MSGVRVKEDGGERAEKNEIGASVNEIKGGAALGTPAGGEVFRQPRLGVQWVSRGRICARLAVEAQQQLLL